MLSMSATTNRYAYERDKEVARKSNSFHRRTQAVPCLTLVRLVRLQCIAATKGERLDL
jgi:hypothetical protein